MVTSALMHTRHHPTAVALLFVLLCAGPLLLSVGLDRGLHPAPTEPPAEARAEATLAMQHYKAGEYAQSLDRFAAIWQTTQYPDYGNNAGMSAFRMGDFAQARQYFEAVLANHPTNTVALANLAHVLHQMGDIRVRAMRSSVHGKMELGEWDAAGAAARSVLMHRPNDASALDVLRRVNVERQRVGHPPLTIPTLEEVRKVAAGSVEEAAARGPTSGVTYTWMSPPCAEKSRGARVYGPGTLYASIGFVSWMSVETDPSCTRPGIRVRLAAGSPTTELWVESMAAPAAAANASHTWLYTVDDSHRHTVLYRPLQRGRLCIEVQLAETEDSVADAPVCLDIESVPYTPTERGRGAIPVMLWGMLMASDGISHVNAHLYRHLVRDPSIRLSIEHTIDPYMIADARFQHTVSVFERKLLAETYPRHSLKDRQQIAITNKFPLAVPLERSGIRVVYFPWECDTMPAAWVGLISTGVVTEVWAPTHYVRDAWVRSGAPADQVHVVPYGVDMRMFNPQVPPTPLDTTRRWKFLFNSGVMGRKGLDLVLKAYLEEFGPEEDTALVVKVAYRGFDSAVWSDIDEIRARRPDVIILPNKRPLDSVPGLYTAADCLVQPYRAEGFGLTMLEAMASGLPVILTGAGAAMDFASNDTAYLIRSTEKPCGFPCKENGTRVWLLLNDQSGAPLELPLTRQCMWAEPDLMHLRALMRYVFTHQDEARAVGRRASEHVAAHWSWDHAYAAARARIEALWQRRHEIGVAT